MTSSTRPFRIQFYTKEASEILRYTSLDIIYVGEEWTKAYAHDTDLGTFDLNGWYYDIL